jgi:pimeloyl-ACP methyl ester carboxylesterase
MSKARETQVQSPGIDENHGVLRDDLRPTLADKPTIVFVHGAFTDASAWDQVAKLIHGHCPYLLAANPLLGLEADTEALVALLRTISGEMILVGHSYGGALITNAANLVEGVTALVYVSAIAPDEGESLADLVGRFPGAGLSGSLIPLELGTGRLQLLLRPDQFRRIMAHDLPPDDAVTQALRQRPAAPAVFTSRSGRPAWRRLSSWFIYGDQDRCLPAELHAYMARRAGAVDTVVVEGASHSVPITNPKAVARLVQAASMSETFEVPNLDP